MLLLQRTWIQFLKLTLWVITICNSTSTGSNTLFWDSWTPGIHTVHKHANKTLTHIFFLNLKEGRIPGDDNRPFQAITMTVTRSPGLAIPSAGWLSHSFTFLYIQGLFLIEGRFLDSAYKQLQIFVFGFPLWDIYNSLRK